MSLYRKCVAVIVRNIQGKYLSCERKDIPGAWQFPQGGIETSESIINAAIRELYEETGITSVELLGVSPDVYRYDFPAKANVFFGEKQKYIGQELSFCVFQFTGSDDEIDLDRENQEFKDWKWDSLDNACQQIVEFKRGTYLSAIKDLRMHGIVL